MAKGKRSSRSIARDTSAESKLGGKYPSGVYRVGDEKMAADEKTSPAPSKDPKKIHVRLYLMSKATKPWEMGGKIAFAEAKGKQYATEKEFDALFATY